MPAYYNEIDPYAAQWMRNLIAAGHIAPGDVDERSILEVRPDDLRGYTQCHFFAGIGGWSYAMRLAGWPDDRPVWTGSCPCQPFSSASGGKDKRHEDGRHLWPVWARLIAASKPRAVFGEQVVDAGDWIDGVCDNLEALGYEVGACVLPACAVGFDHARPRIYFAGHANMHGKPRIARDAPQVAWVPRHRGVKQELALEDGLSRRMGAMRAYGNAIVPQVAAVFVMASVGVEPVTPATEEQ
jgi:DNA (cytosine-5)-methyltransferase 1